MPFGAEHVGFLLAGAVVLMALVLLLLRKRLTALRDAKDELND